MGNFMSCVLICGAMEVVQVVNTNGRVEKLIRPIRAAELIWAHERYKAALAAGLNPSPAFKSSDSAPSKLQNPDAAKSKPNPSPPPTKASPRSEDSSGNKFVLLPLDPSKPTSNIPVAEVGCRAYNFQCLSEENVSVKQVKKARSSSSSNKGGNNNNGSTTSNNTNKKEQPQGSPGVNNNHPPFRVKKEGGVTTLVVSKRYLEQLLSEKELKTSNNDMAAADILRDHNYLPSLHSNTKHSSRRSKSCSSSSGRVSIWRPALESISESHNNSNVGSTSGHHLSLHHQQQLHHHHHHHRHHHQRQQ